MLAACKTLAFCHTAHGWLRRASLKHCRPDRERLRRASFRVSTAQRGLVPFPGRLGSPKSSTGRLGLLDAAAFSPSFRVAVGTKEDSPARAVAAKEKYLPKAP